MQFIMRGGYSLSPKMVYVYLTSLVENYRERPRPTVKAVGSHPSLWTAGDSWLPDNSEETRI